MTIAVLITVFNRKEKTLKCLSSLKETVKPYSDQYRLKVFLTDDGCSDGTVKAIEGMGFEIPIVILPGTGSLYWNGGMINSWKSAIADSTDYDGYLWLNNDTVVLPEFWRDLKVVNDYSIREFGKKGIYVGSTMNPETGEFTYGGFNYVNKFLLKDKFVLPDGESIKKCEACHGNITFVSNDVVESEGIFCEGYLHGGTDHDYSYLAQKHGFPMLVMPHYCATCENDHIGNGDADKVKRNLKERIAAAKSPFGRNFHNTMLFNKRCFPWRLPFVFFSEINKILFPEFAHKIYLFLRTH